MRELGILISPDSNEIIYEGKPLKGMSNPSPLAFLYLPFAEKQTVSPIVAKQRLGEGKGHWPTFSAKVERTQEIPNRAAKIITIRVDKAQVGSDVCIDGASNTHRIAVKSTFSRVIKGNLTEALVVNTSGAPITLKHGQHIGQVLVFDRQISSEPEELPSASQSHDATDQQSPSLESFIKVAHYNELKSTPLQVLEMHRRAIALPGKPLGVTHCAEHHIKLKPGSNPVYINAYKLPHSQRHLVEELIKDMLDQGVIQESNSPWKSPLFLVPKKDGTLRPIIDFRRVNEVTVDDHYLLPVLRDLLMCLDRGNKVSSTLDLLRGYWQLPKAPESREVTAFSTPNSHFEWTRMPFGLKGAQLTFPRTMNNIFGGMLGNSVYIYLDDIIIGSKNTTSHMETLKSALKQLQEEGLKLKLTKCEFLKHRIKFLGHEVDEQGIHTVDDKTAAVAQFPQPKTVENVRSFLGQQGIAAHSLRILQHGQTP